MCERGWARVRIAHGHATDQRTQKCSTGSQNPQEVSEWQGKIKARIRGNGLIPHIVDLDKHRVPKLAPGWSHSRVTFIAPGWSHSRVTLMGFANGKPLVHQSHARKLPSAPLPHLASLLY